MDCYSCTASRALSFFLSFGASIILDEIVWGSLIFLMQYCENTYLGYCFQHPKIAF